MIGLVYIGILCGDNFYYILEDFIVSVGFLWVMIVYEFGYNFGCVYNYNFGEYECYVSSCLDFIMDLGVSLLVVWIMGEFVSCDVNIVNQVNVFLVENFCLVGCLDVCDLVSGLNVIFDFELLVLDIIWEDEGVFVYVIFLKDMNSLLVDIFFIIGVELMLSDEILFCVDYEFIVVLICGEQWGICQVIFLEMEEQVKMYIIDVKFIVCNFIILFYDFVVEVVFEEIFDDGFIIWVGEDYFLQMYEISL